MLKTVLKIDGMMCGMCESHMNDLIRKHCKVKKVSSSAKKRRNCCNQRGSVRYSYAGKGN